MSLQLTLVDADAVRSETRVRAVRDVAEWDAMEHDWARLFASSPTASPPLRFQWLRQWWRIYSPAYANDGEALRILTVWRDSQLIGALPLYQSGKGGRLMGIRQLGFVSMGEAEFEETCPDYMDLLHAPGEEQGCLDAITAALLQGAGGDWDEIELCDLSQRSPLLNWQQSMPHPCRVTVAVRGVCPIADISGGLDAYLARLSANTRQQCRRLLRAATRAGVRMEVASDADQATRFFDDLVRLHQQRWTSVGQPGCFAAPRFAAFHRWLATTWVPQGKAVLTRLSVGTEPLGVIYGFRVGAKFDFYQSGVLIDHNPSVPSSGTVAFLLLMEYLAQQGIREFDFLRGPSAYKQRLATVYCPLVRLRVVRPSYRRSAHVARDLLGRAWRKGRRLLGDG